MSKENQKAFDGDIYIIGQGRVGSSFSNFLESIGLEHKFIKSYKEINNPVKAYIFLAVPDAALKDFVESKSEVAILIHFSGFYYFENAIGVHPVFSFSKNDKTDWNTIDFVADHKLDENLQRLFKKTDYIDPKNKGIYHTYLSTTANSIQLLMNLVGEGFSKKTNLDKKYIKDLTIQSLMSEREKEQKSFTGPWVRGEMQGQLKKINQTEDELLIDINELFLKNIKRYKNECS